MDTNNEKQTEDISMPQLESLEGTSDVDYSKLNLKTIDKAMDQITHLDNAIVGIQSEKIMKSLMESKDPEYGEKLAEIISSNLGTLVNMVNVVSESDTEPDTESDTE